jgi:hypothetical protein
VRKKINERASVTRISITVTVHLPPYKAYYPPEHHTSLFHGDAFISRQDAKTPSLMLFAVMLIASRAL